MVSTIKNLIINYRSKKIVDKLNKYNAYNLNSINILLNKLNTYKNNNKAINNIYYDKLISDINEFIRDHSEDVNPNIPVYLGNYINDLIFLIKMQKYTNKKCIFVINIIYKST